MCGRTQINGVETITNITIARGAETRQTPGRAISPEIHSAEPIRYRVAESIAGIGA